MLDLFGSQFGLIIVIIIIMGGYWLFKTITGDKDKLEEDEALGCLLISGGIGFVVVIVCFLLSQCSSAN